MPLRLLISAFACALVVGALVAARVCRADTSPTQFDPLVRVHLDRFLDGCTELRVSSTGAFRLSATGGAGAVRLAETVSDGRSLAIGSGSGAATERSSSVVVRLAPSELLSLSATSGAEQIFSIQKSGALAHRYRGNISISCLSDATLRVIDSLPLEQYLYGVVGPEIGASAPIEALKAQAIAARTFAVKNFDKNQIGDSDLDDTTRSQIYLGYDAERPSVLDAVDLTAGKIVTYHGQPIDAVYATDCGGVTAEGSEPYLKSVVDDECRKAPPWTVCIPISDLCLDLTRAGVKGVNDIVTIAVKTKDSSGRIVSLAITDKATGNIVSIAGETMRRAIGYDKLRSTLFEISLNSTKQTCLFTGYGWGHGLGMCQRGAVFMARSGAATCEQILEHYYTGVEVSDLTSDFLQRDGDVSRNAPWAAPASSAKSPAIPGSNKSGYGVFKAVQAPDAFKDSAIRSVRPGI